MLISACIVLLIACVVACVGLWRMQAKLTQLQTALNEVARDYDRAGGEVGAFMADIAGSRVIVEVLEPVSLAHQESRFAGPVSGVAPKFLHRRVYATVASELRTELAARGVDARVEVMHAGEQAGRS